MHSRIRRILVLALLFGLLGAGLVAIRDGEDVNRPRDPPRAPEQADPVVPPDPLGETGPVTDAQNPGTQGVVRILGRCVDAAIRPLSGVIIRLYEGENSILVTTSGHEGRFEIVLGETSFTRLRTPHLTLEKDRRIASIILLPPLFPETDFSLGDVIVATGVTVHGTVVSASGEPVPGAVLHWAVRPAGREPLTGIPEVRGQVVADGVGACEVKGVMPGTLRLHARAPVDGAWEEQPPVLLEPGEPMQVMVVLHDPRWIEIRLSGADAPLAPEELELLAVDLPGPLDLVPLPLQVLDRERTFRTRVPSRYSGRVRVATPGFRPAWFIVRGGQHEHEVSLIPSPGELVLSVTPGEPDGEVWVGSQLIEGAFPPLRRHRLTGGMIRVPALEVGLNERILVLAGDGARGGITDRLGPLALSSGERPIPVALSSHPVLRVRCIDGAGGHAIEGAGVRLLADGKGVQRRPTPWGLKEVAPVRIPEEIRPRLETRSDAGGVAVLHPPDFIRWRVQAVRGDLLSPIAEVPRTGGEVTLTLATGATILVEGLKLEDLAETVVAHLDGDFRNLLSPTGLRDGAAEFAGLLPGRYLVSSRTQLPSLLAAIPGEMLATSPPAGVAVVSLAAGDRCIVRDLPGLSAFLDATLELRLPAPERLSLDLLPSGLTNSVTPLGAVSISATNRFLRGPLPPGAYVLRLFGTRHFPMATLPVQLHPDQTTRVKWPVEWSRLTLDLPETWTGSNILLLDRNDTLLLHEPVPDPASSLLVIDLAPGEYRLTRTAETGKQVFLLRLAPGEQRFRP